MNITPIASVQSQTFTGKIITKGKWPENLKKSFVESETLNRFVNETNQDVVGRIKRKKAPAGDFNHTIGEPLFKINLNIRKPNESFIDRIKELLKLKSGCSLTKKYHSNFGTEDLMERRLSKILDKTN